MKVTKKLSPILLAVVAVVVGCSINSSSDYSDAHIFINICSSNCSRLSSINHRSKPQESEVVLM